MGWFWFDKVSEAEIKDILRNFMNDEGLLEIGDPALNAYNQVLKLQKSREA